MKFRKVGQLQKNRFFVKFSKIPTYLALKKSFFKVPNLQVFLAILYRGRSSPNFRISYYNLINGDDIILDKINSRIKKKFQL